jgi:hypothetical protein
MKTRKNATVRAIEITGVPELIQITKNTPQPAAPGQVLESASFG